jgi:hypothetical protein
MKWVILGAGLVALAIVVMAVAGSMLSVKHHASRKARIGQPSAAIYAVIAGPPVWRADVKASGSLPDSDGRKRWWEQDGHGKKITYELIEDSPLRRVTRIADEKLPYGGRWTVEITPLSERESEVRVTEDGEVYNPVFRFLARFVFGYTGTIEGYLGSLGAKFGEQPKIEG